MTILAQPPPDAKWLEKFAQFARSGVDRDKRAAFGKTSAGGLEAIAEAIGTAVPNRADRRAVEAQERASERPAATPSPKATEGKRRAARRRHAADTRATKRERNYAAALADRAKVWRTDPDDQGPIPTNWRRIPTSVKIMGKDVVSATNGRAFRHHARHPAIRHMQSALGAVRRAALVPQPDGSTLRTWSSETARRIAALGLALMHLSVSTTRKGPWRDIVRGIPVSALRWLICHPGAGERPPHWNALIGRHRGHDSTIGRGQLGYLRELEQAGFMVTQQGYPDPESWEVGPAGYSMNRYWIVESPGATADAALRAELIELHREGWLALNRHPVRSARRRVLYTVNPAETGVPPPAD